MDRLGAGFQRFDAETECRFRLQQRTATERSDGGNISATVYFQRFHLKRSGLLLVVLMLVLGKMELGRECLRGLFPKCSFKKAAGFSTLRTRESSGFQSSLSLGRENDFDRLHAAPPI